MKRSYDIKLTDAERRRYRDGFYNAIAAIKTHRDAEKLLDGLLSNSEKIMLGRRVAIAERLREGQQYRQISNELGVGFDTITFVGRWLKNNPRGSRLPKRSYSITSRGGTDKQPSEFQKFLKKYPSRNALLKAIFEK